MSKTFVNTAKPCDPKVHCRYMDDPDESRTSMYYGFDCVPKLLFPWAQAFQVAVSQAATRLLTGKFHDRAAGIYKCEGGCNIPGKGDLVLYHNSCRWDHGRGGDDEIRLLCKLITAMVLRFDPMEPLASIFNSAAAFLNEQGIGVTADEIRKAGEKSGGPFMGDALSDFFKHNPFSKWHHDRDYLRYCYTRFESMTDAEVDQKFADEDLGEKLMETMNESIKKASRDRFPGTVMACSPSRKSGSLQFWVNDGREFYGWFTEEELNEVVRTGKKPVRK